MVRNDILLWKCSSELAGRRLEREGVDGDPSSPRRLKLACMSCPWRFGTKRSPYILCLFRLGLAVGVLSRGLAVSASARLRALASTAPTGPEDLVSLVMLVKLRLGAVSSDIDEPCPDCAV